MINIDIETSNEINKLKELKKALSTNTFDCHELERYLGFSIPADLCSFITNAPLDSDQEMWFWHMTAMSYDRVLSQYVDPEEYDFSMVYGVKNGILNEVECNLTIPTLLNNEQCFLDQPLEVVSIKKIIPLMISEDGGSFLLYSLDETLGKGLVFVEQTEAYFIAPSFLEHIDDLIKGLESEKYTLGEGTIYYPFLWHERIQVQSCIKEMDEYGDVE